MATYRVIAKFPSRTGLAEDIQTNSWCFFVDPEVSLADGADEILARLEEFYDDDHGLDSSYCHQMLGVYQDPTVPVTLTGYNLVDEPFGVPIWTRTFTPTYFTGPDAGLPRECTPCVSFKSTTAATPNGRRKGRLYLPGPLHKDSSQTGAGAGPTVSAGLMDIIGRAATALMNHGFDDGVRWMVWSGVDDTPYPIDRIAVDNAWDTQRRRGVEQTLYEAVLQGGTWTDLG
jgi:hypothetical protein